MDVTRVNIPECIVRSDRETSVFMDQIGIWLGPFTTLAVVPVRRGTRIFYNFFCNNSFLLLGDKWLLGLDCCHARDENSAEGVGVSRKQNIKQFKEHFKDFAPAIQKVLSYVKAAHVWRIFETIPPSWVSKSGRVVLIGDAAHAILPWIGQVIPPSP
jgi:salicylate hydroxylase